MKLYIHENIDIISNSRMQTWYYMIYGIFERVYFAFDYFHYLKALTKCKIMP